MNVRSHLEYSLFDSFVIKFIFKSRYHLYFFWMYLITIDVNHGHCNPSEKFIYYKEETNFNNIQLGFPFQPRTHINTLNITVEQHFSI